MNRIALFPGSFDPFTIGHLAILDKATSLFDKIIVAVGINSEKHQYQPLDSRLASIRHAVERMPNVDVASYSCLTTDFCRQQGAKFILRGVRDNADFEYERKIADINRLVAPEIETIILLADPDMAIVSSSMVRELAAFGHDVKKWIA